MIVIIGADGFLGIQMLAKLRDAEIRGLASGFEIVTFTDTDDFFRFLPLHFSKVEWVFYCDKRIPNTTLSVSRYEFVQKLWTVSARYSVPLLYAFHQPGELPDSDFQPDHFVVWAGRQYQKPLYWYIFKMGEIYGWQEDVAGECTSRIHTFYHQILSTGEATLPQSEQKTNDDSVVRDYLYVQDAVRVFYWFMQHRPANGVYELGSGFARTDLAVVNAIFRALKLPPRIRYSHSHPSSSEGLHAPFLPDLRNLRHVGYKKKFIPVENGVKSALKRHHWT